MKRPCIVFGSNERLWFLVFQSLWFILPLCAQTPISISDTEGRPVVGAHVIKVDSLLNNVIVSDVDGMAVVPEAWFHGQNVIPVKVTSVGSESRSFDLKRTGEVLFVKLKTSPERLAAFVVTGQYKPEDPRNAVQRVRVLSREKIERMAPRNVSDVLANEFNIRLGQDNILGTSISMQGLSGQNIKILIDGVPMVGRQDGNIDLSQILLNGVERIEVVEGPMSVNYGTNAIAGTINIITRSEGNNSGYAFRSYAEHIGKLDLSARVYQKREKSNWSIDLSRNFFAGWDPSLTGMPDFSPNLADSSRYQQWKPRTQFLGRFNYGLNLGEWKLGYKGEFMRDYILNRGMPRAPQQTTAFDETYRTRRLDNAIFVNRTWKQSAFKAILAHNRYDRYRNTYFNDLTELDPVLIDVSGFQDTSSFYLTNSRFTYASTNDSAFVNWEVGADLNNERGAGARIGDGTGEEINDFAVFASAQIELFEGFIARPGLRYSYNSVYEAPLTPALNLRWQPNSKYTLRASYAQGFRAPSLKELYLYFVDVNHNIVGNANLEAESSQNVSFGVVKTTAKETGRQDLEVSLSYNLIDDMIALVGITPTEFTYQNFNRVTTLAGRLSFAHRKENYGFRIGAGFTGRKDVLLEDGENNELATETPFYLSAEASTSFDMRFAERYTFFTQYRFQGEQRTYVLVNDVDLLESILGDYHLLEANVSRKFMDSKLKVSIGCKDLLNTQNISFAGSSGQPHSVSGGQSPLTTGRTVFLQLNLNLE